MRVSTTLCASSGTVNSQSQCGGGGREGRHAGGERERDAVSFEPAQLLGERAVDRKIAGMQPRHVMAGLVRRHELSLDLVERQRRGVDDAGAVRAVPRSSRGTIEPA